MQQSLTLTLGLPAALCIIMLGLGLSLRIRDFARIISRPAALLTGLCCNLVLLPAFCFVLVSMTDLPPAIQVGMMLLAASPGGTSAAVYTHLARGDVALSITFSAVSSVIALASLPIIANLSLLAFYGGEGTVGVQFGEVLQIFAFAIVPALIGVYVRERFPAFAERLAQPVKLMAALFLAAVILLALAGQWRLILVWGPTIGAVVLTFNLAALAIGYAVPRLMRIERPQAVALSMSVGIHNAALVITVAMSEYMLNEPEMAIPPAAYGLIAYITSALLVGILNRTRPAHGRIDLAA